MTDSVFAEQVMAYRQLVEDRVGVPIVKKDWIRELFFDRPEQEGTLLNDVNSNYIAVTNGVVTSDPEHSRELMELRN